MVSTVSTLLLFICFIWVHTEDRNVCVILRINCINIGWCFLSVQVTLAVAWNAHNADDLLLNFHYITHWFQLTQCKWNCVGAFSASALMKFPFFGVSYLCFVGVNFPISYDAVLMEINNSKQLPLLY